MTVKELQDALRLLRKDLDIVISTDRKGFHFTTLSDISTEDINDLGECPMDYTNNQHVVVLWSPDEP